MKKFALILAFYALPTLAGTDSGGGGSVICTPAVVRDYCQLVKPGELVPKKCQAVQNPGCIDSERPKGKMDLEAWYGRNCQKKMEAGERSEECYEAIKTLDAGKDKGELDEEDKLGCGDDDEDCGQSDKYSE